MVTESLPQGKPINRNNSTKNGIRYQHRRYPKYMNIVLLFGWKILEDFWRTQHLGYIKGIEHPENTLTEILTYPIKDSVDAL